MRHHLDVKFGTPWFTATPFTLIEAFNVETAVFYVQNANTYLHILYIYIGSILLSGFGLTT